MSQNNIAVSQTGRSRDPATRDAAFEQLVRARRMVDQGDRPDSAESGRVKHQKYFRRYADDHVVREFILSNDGE
jgi:hypothetical protein